jgi:hypothetical protein
MGQESQGARSEEQKQGQKGHLPFPRNAQWHVGGCFSNVFPLLLIFYLADYSDKEDYI